MWYTASMIEINELRINSVYRFDFGPYSAFGKYVGRDGNVMITEETLIYMMNKERIFFEEQLLIDARTLRNICIGENDADEDHSDYYANYDYNDKGLKR